MALYSYKAIDGRGKSLMGQLEAINLIDLELRLQRMGLDLIVGGLAKRRASMFKGAIGRPQTILGLGTKLRLVELFPSGDDSRISVG